MLPAPYPAGRAAGAKCGSRILCGVGNVTRIRFYRICRTVPVSSASVA